MKASLARRDSRHPLARSVALATAMVLAPAICAQSFPNRPLRIVYPYSAGSGPDVLGRMLSEDVSRQLGQPVIWENKPGADGRLGLPLMRGAPDGHVLNLVNDGMAISQPAKDPTIQLQPGKEYAAVGILFGSPLALIGRTGLPYKDMKGMAAFAKANPGKINFAVASGASADFLTQRVALALGLDMTIIGYKGGAEAGAATLGGHTDLFFSTTSMKPAVDAGKLVAMATSGPSRWKPFASAPTLQESGVPITYNVTFPLIAAPETPRENIVKLNRAFHTSTRAPEIVAHMEKLGFEPMTQMTPEESTAFIKSEIEAWTPILRQKKAR